MHQPVAGRCYCGRVRVASTAAPDNVAACMCADCRRWTGTPIAAFAAFQTDGLSFTPPLGPPQTGQNGVQRWICTDCGTPLLATFGYLPGQVFLPAGIVDDPASLVPDIACFTDPALDWLHLAPGIDCLAGAGRARLESGMAPC